MTTVPQYCLMHYFILFLCSFWSQGVAISREVRNDYGRKKYSRVVTGFVCARSSLPHLLIHTNRREYYINMICTKQHRLGRKVSKKECADILAAAGCESCKSSGKKVQCELEDYLKLFLLRLSLSYQIIILCVTVLVGTVLLSRT